MSDSTSISPQGAAAVIQTDYRIGQDNLQPRLGAFSLDIHNPVFVISGVTIIVFVFFALALPAQAEAFFGWLRPALTSTFDWFFLLAGNIFVLVALALMLSPLGKIRIGGMDAKPDYSYAGWFAMLFAAGMGIGLMFFGFGERVWGWTGHIIDTLAVFATLFGLATSLGIGAEQANAGLEFLFGIPVNDVSKVLLITGITAIAVASVVAGLDRGVKRLSEINMVLAALLLLFVIAAGPTLAILTGFFTNLVAYAEYLPALSNPLGRDDDNFRQDWTSFYWAWWISWSPFVGMFIARVSRGRTVREFILCVLLIPSLVSVLWMTAFGGSAIALLNEGYQAVAEAPLELKLFSMLDAMALAGITSFIAIVLVIVFFVTSSDSGSLVIDTITAGGKVDAPVAQRIFWAAFEGMVAIALLLGGGLGALQAASVSTGLPFAAVLLLGCYALVRGLLSEPRRRHAAA